MFSNEFKQRFDRAVRGAITIETYQLFTKIFRGNPLAITSLLTSSREVIISPIPTETLESGMRLLETIEV